MFVSATITTTEDLEEPRDLEIAHERNTRICRGLRRPLRECQFTGAGGGIVLCGGCFSNGSMGGGTGAAGEGGRREEGPVGSLQKNELENTMASLCLIPRFYAFGVASPASLLDW